ncbi:unnamed protein product [Closterium sp. NIES-65]|nr:unnamed protein product [Closterium sp. NIES-65]
MNAPSDESRELEDRHVAVSLASHSETSSLTDPLLTRREPPARAARKGPLLLVVSLCACLLATLLLSRSILLCPHSLSFTIFPSFSLPSPTTPFSPSISALPSLCSEGALSPPRLPLCLPARHAAAAPLQPAPPTQRQCEANHLCAQPLASTLCLPATQMGLVGAHMHPQFVVSLGDNFLELGLPDVNAPQFAQSFTNIYTHRSLQIPCSFSLPELNAPQFAQSFTNIYTHRSLQIPWYAVLGNHYYYGERARSAASSPGLSPTSIPLPCPHSFFPVSLFPCSPSLPAPLSPDLGNHNYYGNVLAQLHPALAMFLGNHDYYGNVLAQLHPALANRDPRWTCRRSMALSLPICAEMDEQSVDHVDPVDSAGQGVDRVDSGGGQGVDCVDFVDLFLYDSMPLIPAYRHKEGRRVDWRGLNTGNWSRQEEAQLQELEGWLSNSQARWKVVGAHHPVFSYGKHGDQPEMVERIKPLLEVRLRPERVVYV